MPIAFIPGGTDGLVKAELQAQEGAKTKITCYFNPKEITIDKPVPWQKHKNVEGDEPTLEFTAAEPKTLACELMFDMFEEKGDVYAKYISQLEQLALIQSDVKRPPMVTFTWGNNMPVFKGVIEDLNVKYTLFLPNGTPCRATVNIKMKQASKLMNKEETDAANKAEAQQSGTTAQAGQTPTQTAQAAGYPPTSSGTRAAMDAAGADGHFPPGTPVPGPPPAGSPPAPPPAGHA
jgi:contractile injection system tube protein